MKSLIRLQAIIVAFVLVLCTTPCVSAPSQVEENLREDALAIMASIVCADKVLYKSYPDSNQFGKKLGDKYKSKLDATSITAVLGMAVSDISGFEKNFNPEVCKKALPPAIKLAKSFGLNASIFQETLDKINGNNTIAPDVADQERLSNISDMGFMLGYVSACSDVPSAASSRYYDWASSQYGESKIGPFSDAFQDGEEAYAKNKGRDCDRFKKNVAKLGIEASDSQADEDFSPVAKLFNQEGIAKLYACEENPDDDTLAATVSACKKYYKDRFMILNKNGKGFYTSDDGKSKARFNYEVSQDNPGVISFTYGANEMSFGFYRNKYANGYGSAYTVIPFAFIAE